MRSAFAIVTVQICIKKFDAYRFNFDKMQVL